jgi:XTP/dITP diphosphohydrolase
VNDRRRLLVATRSPHKLRELRELLDLPNVNLVSLDEAGIEGEPVEDGATFEANARLKAGFYGRASGLPTLADDSGLEVDALGGGPGVRTRRYAGDDATDADNNAKLLRELEGLGPERRGAQYVCVLALALPDEPVRVRRGTCRGRIARAPKGTGGFGYDPIFVPVATPPGDAPADRSLGEWSAEDKNRISHRAQAARRMSRLLRSTGF